MFGTNERLGVERGGGETLLVREAFYTIQGEGPKAGWPAVFVRLAGCNLACSFCDTDFDVSKSGRQTVDELVRAVRDLADGRTRLVVLTGGEPLRQPVAKLLDALVTNDFVVQIETSGSVYKDWASHYRRDRVEVVVSPKTPKLAPGMNAVAHAWKYIVEHDSQFTDRGVPYSKCQGASEPKPLAEPPLQVQACDVFLQPCDHLDETLNALAMSKTVEACLRYGYRLSLQTHKTVGVR